MGVFKVCFVLFFSFLLCLRFPYYLLSTMLTHKCNFWLKHIWWLICRTVEFTYMIKIERNEKCYVVSISGGWNENLWVVMDWKSMSSQNSSGEPLTSSVVVFGDGCFGDDYD
jgi:hypothetical protein